APAGAPLGALSFLNSTTMELAKSFDPHEVESRWYFLWESRGYFRDSSNSQKPPYCIQLPPPNVTGTLHMGHAFQQTLMDALIRFHRMRGFNTNWVVGTDHAGIATQIVVERQLEEEGKSRHDLGREKFVERVWQWKQQSASSTAASASSTGIRCSALQSPTSRSTPRKKTASSGSCAIRSRTARVRSASRPRVRRPCWATWRSRCIPRMSAIAR